MKTRIAQFTAFALAIATPGIGFASSLYGSTATTAIYCCAAPTEPNRITHFISALVGPMLEFPQDSFVFFPNDPGSGVDVDVGQSSLTFTSVDGAAAVPATFNGYVFTFVQAPPIQAVSIDTGSDFIPVDLTFTSDSITVNFAGVAPAAGGKSILDITLAPVPEEPTMLLFGVGLLALRMLRNRMRPGDA